MVLTISYFYRLRSCNHNFLITFFYLLLNLRCLHIEVYNLSYIYLIMNVCLYNNKPKNKSYFFHAKRLLAPCTPFLYKKTPFWTPQEPPFKKEKKKKGVIGGLWGVRLLLFKKGVRSQFLFFSVAQTLSKKSLRFAAFFLVYY